MGGATAWGAATWAYILRLRSLQLGEVADIQRKMICDPDSCKIEKVIHLARIELATFSVLG